ncbi:MAG: hypothetical protein R3315_10830 [Woeseiaceae bacterium]|nr:hypothetical protein [Woeseiaceae bacterium]
MMKSTLKTTRAGMALVLLCTMLGAGCASGPGINVVPPGEAITVRGHAPESDRNWRYQNDAVEGSAAKGASGGFVVGAVSGLSCGPWLWICSPLGAIGGAFTGGMGGAIVGLAVDLTDEQKSAIGASLERYFAANDPQERLVAVLSSRLSSTWQPVDEASDHELSVGVVDVRLRGKTGSRAALQVRAVASVRAKTAEGKMIERRRTFELEDEEFDVRSWIEDDGDFLESRFEIAYRTLAERIYIAMSES